MFTAWVRCTSINSTNLATMNSKITPFLGDSQIDFDTSAENNYWHVPILRKKRLKNHATRQISSHKIANIGKVRACQKKKAAVHRDRLKNSKWHLYTLQEDRKQNVMQTCHREATSDRELCREVSRTGRTVWLCHQVFWPRWRNHAGACFCLANRWLKCGQICTKPSPKISHARHVLSQT